MRRKIFVFLSFLFIIAFPASADEFHFSGASDTGEIYEWKKDGWKKRGQTDIPAAPYFQERINLLYRDEEKITAFTIGRGAWDSSDEGKSFSPSEVTAQTKPVRYDAQAKREIFGITNDQNFIIHRHTLLSRKSGWKAVATDLRESRQFHSVATDGKYIYLGTGINGIFRASLTPRNGKLIFKKFNTGIPCIHHDKKTCLYDDITALSIDTKGTVCMGSMHATGIYCRQNSQTTFQRVLTKEINENIHSLYASGETLLASSKKTVYFIENGKLVQQKAIPAGKEISVILAWRDSNPGQYVSLRIKPHTIPRAKQQRIETASGKKLFYTSAYNFSRRKGEVIAMLKRGNYDGMVIDLKDDNGYVRYDSQVPQLKKWGAVRPKLTLKEIDDLIEKTGAYVVVRIVVFKDPVMFKQPGFAILDKYTNAPWIGTEKERWIDPFNPSIASQYYTPLVKEISQSKISEIQFDYIRFPSDGSIHRTKFRYRSGDAYPSEALEAFLQDMRQATDKPISIDIYGYHGLYRASGIIGQDAGAIGRYVDVVAPMLYSSHFGTSYMTQGPRDMRVYNLIDLSTRRYLDISNGVFLVRPWLQGFPMSTGLWGYGTTYFENQVKAGKKYGVNGFTFWGSFDHMLNVEKGLKQRGEF